MTMASQDLLLADVAPSLVAPEWRDFAPLPATLGEGRQGLGEMGEALRQAEQVIRDQQERIRHLESLALTDELTGIANRRGFSLSFERELALARRDADRGGVLTMIDLDGFKGVNDRWGHQAGDAYLCAVAQVLSACVRSSDVVARLGGDEFAILFTGMGEEHAAGRIAKIERAFAARALIWDEQRIPLRASFGFSAYTGIYDAATVIQSADMRLYAHKARNRTLAAPAIRL